MSSVTVTLILTRGLGLGFVSSRESRCVDHVQYEATAMAGRIYACLSNRGVYTVSVIKQNRTNET